MKRSPLLIAAGLVLLCGTGSLAEEENYIMAREEMQAMWQESCTRMNTRFSAEIVTPDELSPYFRHGNDLILTLLPAEGDLSCDSALALAKTALWDKFGVSEEELDAMGVYPRFLERVYQDDENEWEFYFTPVRNIDVTDRHAIPQDGEYLAVIGARTGGAIQTVWFSGGLAEQILEEKAWEAALARSKMAPEAFAETFAPAYIHHYNREAGVCLALIRQRSADRPDSDAPVYQVVLDCRSGRVIELECTNGVD